MFTFFSKLFDSKNARKNVIISRNLKILKTIMKFVLTLSFILLLSVSSIISISAQNNKSRKVDEFGDLRCEDVLAKLDNLAIKRNFDELDSIAFIIVYEGKYFDYSSFDAKKRMVSKYELPIFGEAIARTQSMQLRLKRWNYPMSKFYFIDGGFKENFTVEFWLVPEGANPPKPKPTLEEMKYRRGKTEDFCYSF